MAQCIRQALSGDTQALRLALEQIYGKPLSQAEAALLEEKITLATAQRRLTLAQAELAELKAQRMREGETGDDDIDLDWDDGEPEAAPAAKEEAKGKAQTA